MAEETVLTLEMLDTAIRCIRASGIDPTYGDLVFQELNKPRELFKELQSSFREQEMADYSDITAESIYQTMSPKSSMDRAEKWVGAQNVFTTRAAILEWFDALESGGAENRLPDPNAPNFDQERADLFVQELDADFMIESGRFDGLGVEKGPEFSRLSPSARIAFFQSIKQVMKTESEIYQEAMRRLEEGERLPPLTVERRLEDFIDAWWGTGRSPRGD